MSKYVMSANDMITVTGDASYTVNDTLVINTVISASGAVASGTDVLYITCPHLGEHAEVGWFNTASDSAATAFATVKATTSSKDGYTVNSITLGAATAAGQEYVVTGWVKLK